MEDSTRASSSAKLYFVIFIFVCAQAAPTTNIKDETENTGSGIGHGASSLTAEISAVGPQGQGSSNVDLNGGSWNSANGYLSQGAGYNNAGGNTNGGSNAWATGAGQSVTGEINAQSQSGGSYNVELGSDSGAEKYDSTLPDRGIAITNPALPNLNLASVLNAVFNAVNLNVRPPVLPGTNNIASVLSSLDVTINGNSKRDEELSLTSSGSVEADAGAVMSGSATSGVGGQSSLNLNGGVSSGGSTWFNSPPPSGTQSGYASSNGFIGGSGDTVEGTLDTHDTVNPVSTQVSGAAITEK